MKALLVLTLVAILYSWYLTRNKAFLKQCEEKYRIGQEKLAKRSKKGNIKSRKSRKRTKKRRRKKRRR